MHEQCSVDIGQPFVGDDEKEMESSQHDNHLAQHFGNDVSMGEQFGLQGEAVTAVESDGGGARSLSSNNISFGVSKVMRDKMKRSCVYSPKSQGSSEIPCTTLSQQCSSEKKEAWWQCPHCPFHIETWPASNGDASKSTRCKKAHLQAEHPEEDHSQSMAIKSQRGKDERMKAIRQSKDAKIVDFIDKYEGPHMLAIDGYGVQCNWCDWKGQTSKVPQHCTMKRGGLKLSTSVEGKEDTRRWSLHVEKSLYVCRQELA